MLYKSKEEAYNAYRQSPDSFFERYHELYFNEKDLISPEWKWYDTKYHYNLVENGIIDLLIENDHRVTDNIVLDVGAGTGHWIDFYHYYMESREITGIDFSSVAVQLLQDRYKNIPEVNIIQMDITIYKEEFQSHFDIINAIGIMFHIVDDVKWQAALSSLCNYLKTDGVAVIGGDFGDKTEELGVMRKVRSLSQWEDALKKTGGKITGLKRFDWFKGGINSGLKNNLLVFRRA